MAFAVVSKYVFFLFLMVKTGCLFFKAKSINNLYAYPHLSSEGVAGLCNKICSQNSKWSVSVEDTVMWKWLQSNQEPHWCRWLDHGTAVAVLHDLVLQLYHVSYVSIPVSTDEVPWCQLSFVPTYASLFPSVKQGQ